MRYQSHWGFIACLACLAVVFGFPLSAESSSAQGKAQRIAERFDATKIGESACFKAVNRELFDNLAASADRRSNAALLGAMAASHVCEGVWSGRYAMEVGCGLAAMMTGAEFSVICPEFERNAPFAWETIVRDYPNIVRNLENISGQ